MMEKQFPRTVVGGKSVSRMLIGTNWLLGWSHRTPSADRSIKNRYNSDEAFFPVFEAYMQYGIDTVMAPMDEKIVRAARRKRASSRAPRTAATSASSTTRARSSSSTRTRASSTASTTTRR